jgi:hypothetical protein
MRDPHVFFIGYYQDGDPLAILPEETYASDNSGGGDYQIEVVADLLNGDYLTELILPWMGDKRLLRDVNGKWSVQTRAEADEEEWG